ncbi:MAG: HEAT repeat domain-containing protein [Candidatus Acidiferrum sp.]
MTIRKSFGGLANMNEEPKSIASTWAVSLVISGLFLASPASHAAAPWQSPSAEHFAESQRDAAAEQDKRETEEAALQAQQDKKEAEQNRQAMMDDLYNDGRGFLDEGDYGDAAKKFSELAQMAGPQTDAALYWRAYAENKLGKRDVALESIADLKKRFPQSRWNKDAEALEIEMRQNSGHPVNPDSQSDEDLKILALQGIMNSDPSKGIPMVEKYLSGSANPKDKSKALFLLVQSGSPQAQEMLAKIARGQSNPELQRKAVEYLGMTGGKGSGKLLGEIYASASDPDVKRAVLRSYMMSGDREDLAAVAQKETNESLKREAIHQLGLMGDRAGLQNLYQAESSPDTKKEILQALFLAGDSERLSQLALSEKNPELRKAAIRNLGLMGAKDPALQTIYAKETDRGVKEEIINAYFLGGNASALVAIARSEKDPELKKVAVSKLSLMNSKEGNEYMIELLQK